MLRSPLVRILVAVLLVGAALFWWYRPWSPWSPAAMNALYHPEHREEYFRHLDRVFPSRVIEAPAENHRFPVARTGMPEYFEHEGERIEVEEFLERTRTTGLVVVQDGKIRHEEYRRGADEDARLTSWSVAKTFVATLVPIAMEQGYLDSLDDRVVDHVPELAETDWAEVTVRDLLRMASGMAFDERYDTRFSDLQFLFYRTFLLNRPVDAVIAHLQREEPPGQNFRYISPNTQMLGRVLQEATGEHLLDYLERELWQPLGMEADGFWSTDHQGNAVALCCLNATLRDYARLGQLYLQQGQWQGEALLPDDWVPRATRRPEPWLAAGEAHASRGYGYHLWVPPNPDGEYFASGIWGQMIWVSENHDTVIVKTSADPRFFPNLDETISFMRAVSDSGAACRSKAQDEE